MIVTSKFSSFSIINRAKLSGLLYILKSSNFHDAGRKYLGKVVWLLEKTSSKIPYLKLH